MTLLQFHRESRRPEKLFRGHHFVLNVADSDKNKLTMYAQILLMKFVT